MKRIIQLLIMIAVVFAAVSAWQVWTYGVEGEKKVDAAIVLGAAQWGGKPSPVFEGRIREAVDLYEEGQVDYLIFTGGKSEKAEFSEAEVGKGRAMEAGVPEEDILLEESSLETKENLSESKKILKEKSITSFYLVSDRFHLKRATAMAKDMGIDAEGVPTEYSAYQSLETKLPFFFEEWLHYMWYEVGSWVNPE